jgi:hypothetical protein
VLRSPFVLARSRLRLVGPLVLAAALAACALPGCTSPTLPLPPPSLSALTLADGQVTVEGSAEVGSLVFVLNRDEGQGSITTAEAPDGSFATTVPGQEGEIIVVWSEVDDEQSPTIERAVPPPG